MWDRGGNKVWVWWVLPFFPSGGSRPKGKVAYGFCRIPYGAPADRRVGVPALQMQHGGFEVNGSEILFSDCKRQLPHMLPGTLHDAGWLRAVKDGFLEDSSPQRNVPMTHCVITALASKLSPHVPLSKTRLETLCLLIVAMISAPTVNLSHLASERAGSVLIASTYRRLQRFFQHVSLPEDWSARLVVRLLGLTGAWHLCLDRTNWKIGARDVNILMLAIATQRFRVPLMRTVLDKAGSSNTEERIALMRRYLALFGAGSVKLLLADREFIGLEWLNFIEASSIPSRSV